MDHLIRTAVIIFNASYKTVFNSLKANSDPPVGEPWKHILKYISHGWRADVQAIFKSIKDSEKLFPSVSVMLKFWYTCKLWVSPKTKHSPTSCSIHLHQLYKVRMLPTPSCFEISAVCCNHKPSFAFFPPHTSISSLPLLLPQVEQNYQWTSYMWLLYCVLQPPAVTGNF